MIPFRSAQLRSDVGRGANPFTGLRAVTADLIVNPLEIHVSSDLPPRNPPARQIRRMPRKQSLVYVNLALTLRDLGRRDDRLI